MEKDEKMTEEKEELRSRESDGRKPEEASADAKAESEESNKGQEEGSPAETGGSSKKKKKKPDRQEEKIKELEDKLLRQMAEFENFRKRSEKEKSQMYDMGARSVIEKILPVVDNFERGLDTLTPEQKKEPFAEGIDKVYTQLMTELSGMGVVPIEAMGQPFDPELHNAVMQTQSEEYESGIVAQELQKGYKYRDTVVRHSMVAVVE